MHKRLNERQQRQQLGNFDYTLEPPAESSIVATDRKKSHSILFLQIEMVNLHFVINIFCLLVDFKLKQFFFWHI